MWRKILLALAAILPVHPQEEIAVPTFKQEPLPTTFTMPAPKSRRSPTVAVLLSTMIPGLGHYYLGDTEKGSEILGGTVAGIGAIYASTALHDDSLFEVSANTTQSIVAYGLYSAYCDAKIYNGDAKPFLPRDTYTDLSMASFRWSILKKPEVWGGYLGALTLATTVAYFAYADTEAKVNTVYMQPLCAIPVAVGEEALFRGLLQSAFLDSMPPWAAITLSSTLFGAAHIPNAQMLAPEHRNRYYTFSLPLITGLGAYMGWVSYKNHSLQESTALHMWYDFTLMSLGVLASQAAVNQPVYLHHEFVF